MQHERRRDPYPWTWELPTLGLVLTLILLLVGIQVGRGLANLTAGAGWTWPDTSTGTGFPSPLARAFWSSLPAVLTGDAAAGLPTPDPDHVAGPLTVWAGIGLVELLLIAGAVWASIAFYRRGPGRMRGMATPAEAEALLGLPRLRKVAGFVRPDLHGKHSHPPAVHRTAGDLAESNIDLGRRLSSPWRRPGRGHETGDGR